MHLLRRSPLAAVTVHLMPGNRVAVTIATGPSRTPADAEADLLMLPLGLAALALARAPEDQEGAVRAQLRHAASAVADPQLAAEEPATLCIAVSGLQLEEPGGGGTRVSARLVRSALGPVPTLGRATPPATLVANAATAALAVALAPAGMEVRLAAALAVEGLMGWYTIADPHLQPPQQAIAYALRHAVARLEEENRTPPPALADAVRMQRAIHPMAGGAEERRPPR